MLHASGGVEAVNQHWTQFLKDKGYVVYVIDSFGPRQYKNRKAIGWSKVTSAQLADIKPVYRYLASLPEVDNKRIGLLGFSMGGYDVLRAASSSHFPRLKAAAAFYPVCKRLPKQLQFKLPVAIFIGKSDDRATFVACKTIATHHDQVSLVSYPHAQHGFDNPIFSKTKELTDEYQQTYHIEYHKRAQLKYEQDLAGFLAEKLKH